MQKSESKMQKIFDYLNKESLRFFGLEKIAFNDDLLKITNKDKLYGFINLVNKKFRISIQYKEFEKKPTLNNIVFLIKKIAIKKNSQRFFNKNVTIKKTKKKKYYKLSNAQKRMWVLFKLEPQSHFYNINNIFVKTKAWNVNVLKKTLQFLIERHESFRYKFKEENGRVNLIMRSIDSIKIPLWSYELGNIKNSNEKKEKIKKIIDKTCQIPFKFEEDLLLRAVVVNGGEGKNYLVLTVHHIISDNWSMEIFLKELFYIYEKFIKNEDFKLESLPIGYKDYAEWEQSKENQERLEKQKCFWLKKLSGALPVLNLPVDKKRPEFLSYKGNAIEKKLDININKSIDRFIKKKNVTLFSFLLSIFFVFLHRVSGQNDVIVGTQAANRKWKEVQNIFGCFLNNLNIRNIIEDNFSFQDILNQISKSVIEASDNGEYSFEDLLDKLDLKRDLSRSPIFDVMFQVDFLKKDKFNCNISSVSSELQVFNITKFDLKIRARKHDGFLVLRAEYNTDLFYRETIRRYLRSMETIIKDVLNNPNKKIGNIEIHSLVDKKELLEIFNKTKAEYPKNNNIYELIKKQVKKNPNKTALEFKGKQVSYKELDNRIDSLIIEILKINRRRKKEKIKNIRQTKIGIYLSRSEYSAIAEIAVLKLGFICVPLDITYPEKRLKYIQKDAEINLLITEKGFENEAKIFGSKIKKIVIDANIKKEGKIEKSKIKKIEEISKRVKAKDLAYLMYTSGSTGNPKGVKLHHRGIINQSWHRGKKINVSEKDIFAHTVSTGFVSSIIHWYVPLFIGAKVIIYDDDEIIDPLRLFKVLDKNRVNFVEVIASTLRAYLSNIDTIKKLRLKSLRFLLISGEQTIPSTVNRFFKEYQHIELINGCGQCECSALTLHYIFPKAKTDYRYAPIGKPISNTQVYILDQNLKPVLKGAEGELCISGDGVADGYLNKPDKTKEAFIKHPFQDNKKLYRTGDIVKMLPDNNLIYIRRADHQVQIRGYRVELGEIESELSNLKKVKECRVFARTDKVEDTYLIAYYTGEDTRQEELKEALKNSLPSYMIPNYFYHLKKFPKNANGKIDVPNLPEIDLGSLKKKKYVALITKTERIVAEIWGKILGFKEFSRDDDFFSLGGHSLKAIQVLARINKEFNINLNLKELFKNQKLQELALLVDKQKNKNSQIIINKAISKKNYPLSHAQQRMFVLYKLEPESSFYNICHTRSIEGKLNIKALEKSFKLLTARHEILRTNFKEINGEPVQVIKEKLESKINNYELDKNKNKEKIRQEEKEIVKKNTQKPFKLETDNLLRVSVIKKSKNKHILIVSMHHIISDGWSMNIFYRELTEIYNSILENRKVNLPELSIQYKDYAQWEQSKENQKRLKKQEKYWLKELSGELPVLNLPTDKPRPVMQSYNGDTKYISIDKDTDKKLKQVAEQNNTTLFTLLFAVFNVFLHKISGQNDIIVGTPTNDRNYQEIEDNIGLFVNTLAVRTKLNNKQLFEEFLEKIKDNILESIANKEYPFEQLVEKLNPKRDMTRNPLFSVLFQIFQNNNNNNSKTVKQLHNTKSILKFSNDQITKFDMSIKVIETIKDDLIFVCEYNTNLFNQETIERFLVILKTLTQNIVNNTKQKINNLEIISKQEKQKLLYTFNNANKEYPKNKTIQELFEEQAEKTPKRIAVEFEDKTLTYEELNKKANQLAHYLRKEEKIKPNDVVAIMVERSFEMIIGIFAIIKSGGAYLPISPEAPPERIKYYLNNSNAKILLTQDKTKKEVKISSSKELKVLTIDNLSKITEKEIERKYKDKNPKIINKSNDLIYVIYTSGSTGKPKGVMIRHFSLLNRLNWMKNNFKLDKNDKILQKTNYTFDVSVWELFLWFLNGASLVFLPPKAENNPEIILKTILKNRVSLVHFVPSMFNEFLKHLEKTKSNLKHFSRLVFTSGENLHLAQVEKFFKITKRANKQKNNLGLFNLYGPTEATVDVSYFNCSDIKKTKKVYIGKPIDNHQLYILNQDQKLQPIGIPGELYISGDGLARGYINDKKRAKEVFLPHPFKKDTRIYKTGDLAKMHPDGNIEILGRVDHQIKMRGYRIEPGEIEVNLKKYNNIRDVVVIAKEIKEKQEIKQKQNKQEENRNKQEQEINDKYLVAYYTSNNKKKISSSELKDKLKQNLPEYMIPKFFIHLKQFPLNQNGKLDRLNLPEPKEKDLDKNKYIAPKTEIEKKVAKIWQEVLNVKKISRNDNFFNLGGHSLRAIQVLSRINSQFKIDLGLKEIFKNRELYELALAIKNKLIRLAKININ